MFFCRKVILGVCAVAIVVLAAINLNFARSSGYLTNLSLSSVVSLANNEHGGGGDGCFRSEEVERDWGLGYQIDFSCHWGESVICYVGWIAYFRHTYDGTTVYCCSEGQWVTCN